MKIYTLAAAFFTLIPIEKQSPLDICSPTPITPERLEEIFRYGIELEPVRQQSHVNVQKMLVQRRIDMYFKCKKKCHRYRFPGSTYLWNLDRHSSPRP